MLRNALLIFKLVNFCFLKLEISTLVRYITKLLRKNVLGC